MKKLFTLSTLGLLLVSSPSWSMMRAGAVVDGDDEALQIALAISAADAQQQAADNNEANNNEADQGVDDDEAFQLALALSAAGDHFMVQAEQGAAEALQQVQEVAADIDLPADAALEIALALSEAMQQQPAPRAGPVGADNNAAQGDDDGLYDDARVPGPLDGVILGARHVGLQGHGEQPDDELAAALLFSAINTPEKPVQDAQDSDDEKEDADADNAPAAVAANAADIPPPPPLPGANAGENPQREARPQQNRRAQHGRPLPQPPARQMVAANALIQAGQALRNAADAQAERDQANANNNNDDDVAPQAGGQARGRALAMIRAGVALRNAAQAQAAQDEREAANADNGNAARIAAAAGQQDVNLGDVLARAMDQRRVALRPAVQNDSDDDSDSDDWDD